MNFKVKTILAAAIFALNIATLLGCGPTTNPTEQPTDTPTEIPSVDPTENPTENPTEIPSVDPTETPTEVPTVDPTEDPTETPTEQPTETPSVNPSEDPTKDPNLPDDYDFEEQKALDAFNEKYEMSDFFGTENFVKIDIDMDKEELYRLSEDYDAYPHHSSPIYRRCDIKIYINDDYVQLKKVGLRLKGNTSRRKFVDENGYIYNTVHFKIDLNETFDDIEYSEEEAERIDDRTFLGLKKIDVKWNKNFDTSHIKEYVGLNLYREYGVDSQNIGFSQVVLNDVNMGLFYTYETVDKQFAKRHFSKAKYGGDLYKTCYTATGPADFTYGEVGVNIGEEDEDAYDKRGFFPSYDIKTNKDETNHEDLLYMIEVLNNNESTIEDIEIVVDLDQFVKYEAVSYVLGDPDDLRNNFNNSYLYFNNETGRAEFIPYDKDRMFGTKKDWNPTGDGMITCNPLSNWAKGANVEQRNPLYRKILSRPIDGAQKYIDAYMSLVKEIFEESTTLKNFNNVYEKVKGLYENIVIPDNDLSYAIFALEDPENLTFESYINSKSSYFFDRYNDYYKK